MRKWIVLIITTVMIFALAACSEEKRTMKTEEVHGKELKKLSDDALFETVYLQTLDVVYSFPNEEKG